jgi:hypothetical protein
VRSRPPRLSTGSVPEGLPGALFGRPECVTYLLPGRSRFPGIVDRGIQPFSKSNLLVVEPVEPIKGSTQSRRVRGLCVHYLMEPAGRARSGSTMQSDLTDQSPQDR